MIQTIILRRDKPADREKAARFLAKLPPDKPWRLEVSEYKPRRSDQQNRALFGLAYKTLGAFMGLRGAEEISQLHESMCRMYFDEVERKILDKVVTRPKRTTTTNEDGERSVMSKTEFADFFAFVQQKAAGIGCFIDDPDPEWFMRETKT